jgi:hypothetical protein
MRALAVTSSPSNAPDAMSFARPPTTLSGVPELLEGRDAGVDLGLHAPLRFDEPVAHAVELPREHADLVVLREPEPAREVAVGDAAGLRGERVEGPTDEDDAEPERDRPADEDQGEQGAQDLELRATQERALRAERLGELKGRRAVTGNPEWDERQVPVATRFRADDAHALAR